MFKDAEITFYGSTIGLGLLAALLIVWGIWKHFTEPNDPPRVLTIINYVVLFMVDIAGLGSLIIILIIGTLNR